MAERGSFQYAGSVYPLATSTGNSALKDADPALYYALNFFSSVLTTYLQSRLVAEATAANVTIITQAVAYELPYDPLTVLQEQQWGKFPLLAIWRTGGKDRWRTIGRMDRLNAWKVAYVLPPLTGGQRERLQPFINKSVHDILLDRIENMGDPGWNSGASPWGPAYANLEEISLVGDVTGSYELPQSNLILPAWIGDLQVIERQENVPVSATGGPITGIDINVSDTSQGAPLDLADAQVNFPDPTAISGFVSLYRSDLGVTADTTQDQATSWADQGSGAHNLSAGGSSNEPYILRDPDTGRNILRFDGLQANLTGTATALGADTGKTLVVAFRLYDTAKRSALLTVTDGTTAGTLSLEANTASSAGGLLGLYASGSSFDTQFPTTPGWVIAVLRVTASTGGTSITSNVELQVNAVTAVLTKKSGTGNWSSLGAATTLAVGGQPADLADTDARADLGLAMAFSAKLSDADAASCVTYCQQWLAGVG
jgi:hypothetical protein